MSVDLGPIRAAAAALDAAISALRAAYFKAPRPTAALDQVKARLAHMVEVDQLAGSVASELTEDTRRLSKAQEDALREELSKIIKGLRTAHADEVEKLLAEHGWFNIKKFGHAADSHGWLLVQHADRRPELQKAVLAKLEILRGQGETSQANYAYLWDRVALNEGRPQRYGTQGDADKNGVWTPKKLEDPRHVDERRKSVGLEPLKDYAARFL